MTAERVELEMTPAESVVADVEVEITRLRDLDLAALRARWRIVFRRATPPHLSRHLLFRTLAYRLQADAYGDLDNESVGTLNAIALASPDQKNQILTRQLKQADARLRPGTILSREWGDHLHRVTVLPDGFSWEGKNYKSLSAVAFAIAGSKWNGPRFFGLRQGRDARDRP